jgi:hypothetical protein
LSIAVYLCRHSPSRPKPAPANVADNLTDPSVLIALGDGGAHVDMLCDAGYPT